MKHTFQETSYRNCIIKLVSDPHPESPRNWDNVGTLVCWHKRYNLGDKKISQSPDEYLKSLARSVVRPTYPNHLFEKNIHKILEKHFVILPVYLYDHSGVTINTSGFSCPWDSGQVGFIYTLISEAKTHWPELKGKALKARLTECLQGEIDTYDTYLQGNIAGWITKNENGEEIDSVWGYYPDNSKSNPSQSWQHAFEEAKASIDAYLENANSEGSLLASP